MMPNVFLNYAKCSLNEAKCFAQCFGVVPPPLPNIPWMMAKCSLNDAKCFLNSAKCSLNEAKCFAQCFGVVPPPLQEDEAYAAPCFATCPDRRNGPAAAPKLCTPPPAEPIGRPTL
jgi:hypothetical protein